jgi:hypothetical protein
MDGVYTVVRDAHDGARWDGVAEVRAGRVSERGVWVLADGTRAEGTLQMVWGQGEEAGLLKVVQPHAEHVYMLVDAEEGGFVGQYECGEDMYYVWTEAPAAEGWRMRFEVEGPHKNGWQDVRYERQISQ